MNEIIPNPVELFQKASEVFLSAVNSGSAVDLAIKGVLAYLLAVWIAFVIWVVKDITNRSESLVAQTLSILLVVAFTPIFGLPLYLLVRPRSTLFERYYEEMGLAEASDAPEDACGKCGGIVENDHRYCPHCGEERLVACRSCGKFIGKNWEHCAYCGKDVRKMEKEAKRAEKKPLEKKTPEKETPEHSKRSKAGGGKKKISIVRMEEIPEAEKAR